MTLSNGFAVRTCSLLFVFWFFAGSCYGQEDGSPSPEGLRIAVVEVAGNVTVSRSMVLATVRARSGEEFDTASAAEDASRIALIDAVEYSYYNAEVVGGEVNLTFVVVEKNLVRVIGFNGNKAFNAGKLSKDLGFKKGDYLDIFLVNSGIEAMTEMYHKKGFASVAIETDPAGLPVGRVTYNIDEGFRVKVRSVGFAGNESIKTKELKKAVKTKSRKFFFWPAYYVAQVVSEDVDKLLSIYQEKAFLDVSVVAEPVFSDDSRSLDITFKINEGPVYRVDEIVLRGNEYFDVETLSADMRLRKGEPYSEERGNFDAKKILKRYLEMGFVDAQVNHDYSFRGPAKILAEFAITEGERFRIGRIDISGNQFVQDRVIRRVLDEEKFRPGMWYNADIARGDGSGELEREVKQSAVLESLRILPGERQGDARNVLIEAMEGQTGSVMLGAGVASDSGLIGQLSLNQRNFDISDTPESFGDFITAKAFRGAGQQFRASINPGTIQSSFSISFTEPYLYDMPVSFSTAVSGFERGRESYDEDRLKGYLGVEKRYDNEWRRGISMRVENVEVDNIEAGAPKEVFDVKGDNNMVGARVFIRKDTTDSRYIPSSGYNFDAGFEQVGGDHTFGVFNATQRWYRVIYEDLAERRTILETKVRAATIVGDAPVFEKFYGGGIGADSIRGFDYRGVSTRGVSTLNPAVKDDPIGSDWIVIGNVEVAVPLTSEMFSALFFVDVGAIDSGGIRASVGTGIQILLPQWFGPVPMRFELASPFMKEDEDETRAFSFSIGALF